MPQELSEEELKRYLKGWRKRRKLAYAALIDSYTPEQKQLMATVNRAAAQAALCVTRLNARHVRKKHPISWPADPDQA